MLFIAISVGITILLGLLSIIFRVGAKLRLTLPILYILTASIAGFFTDFVRKNEGLVWLGLFVLLGTIVISWVVSLVQRIRDWHDERVFERELAGRIALARKAGTPIDSISFSENANMSDF